MRKYSLVFLLLLVTLSCEVQAQEKDSVLIVDTLEAYHIDTQYAVNMDSIAAMEASLAKYKKIKMKDCYYNFNRDFSYDFAPFVVGIFALEGGKTDIRAARNKFVPTFDTWVDDYLQYAPAGLAGLLKITGVENRNDWWRFLSSAAMSYAIMTALNNGLKYTIREPRPDNTSSNSMPSGHTATAFVGATILHKEYGLTRSPWYSVAGYTMATATGVLRVMNNRHWVNDVMCGAGVGIISTDLGYFFCDLIFKDKEILREELQDLNSFQEYPSFISLQAGAAFMPNVDMIQTGIGTSVAAEAAYFFHPNIGVGIRGKVTSAPVSIFTQEGHTYDQLAQFHADLGAYFQYPFARRFCVGAQVSYGRIATSYMEFKSIQNPERNLLYVPGTHQNKVGAGLSLAYSHKKNTTWKLHLDYDFSRIPFELRQVVGTRYVSQPFHIITLAASANIRF